MLTQENIPYLYAGLGFKKAVGMPFQDVANSDSIFLHQLPPCLVVPADELEKDPLPNAIALMDLRDAIDNQGKLPAGAIRLDVHISSRIQITQIQKH
mmetsp:Transcript_20834/g.29232  ORF Transcript_20834/g.29232 Transcript_20834/m.29232 type:complete len:97 (+) Transcript_20834:624-914(+)